MMKIYVGDVVTITAVTAGIRDYVPYIHSVSDQVQMTSSITLTWTSF